MSDTKSGKWEVHSTLLPSVLRGTASVLRINPQEKITEAPDLCEQAAQEIIDLREDIAAAHARIEALRAHALKYIEPLTDSMVSDTEQAIARVLERHGERHSEVHGVYPTLLFSARNAIKSMRLARDRARKELAAANEAREKAERERDVARENARVRSGEALDYYSAMLNLAHEFSAKDGDNMIEVIGNGIDALRAEVERLTKERDGKQAEIDLLMFEYCPDEMTEEQIAEYWRNQRPATPEETARIDANAAIDAARKEA